MTLNEYQKKASITAQNHGKSELVWMTYCVMGLTGEAGEVSDKFKKVIRDDFSQVTEDKRLELKSELGDVAWYLSQLSAALGFSLEEICQSNLDKLESRAKRNKISGSGDNR